MSRMQRRRRPVGGGLVSLRFTPVAGLAVLIAGFFLAAASRAEAQQLPFGAFQTYNAAAASSIVAGPFALYTVPVDSLLPTQMNEGFTEVGAKTTGFDLLTPSQLQSNLLGDIEPVVIGPGGVLYLTDGHHTFTALENSSYGATNPIVYVNVIANYSNLSTAQFWAQMEASNLLLPLNDGVPQTVNLSSGSPIPTALTGLTEDVYRGLEYSILKNKNSKLFATTNNITGAVGSSKPGIDKETGLYSDFINADAYRNANGGLGLPYLSAGDIQIATRWNLNPNSVTTMPNVGTVTVGQLPGFILPAGTNLDISSTISNSTLSTGTLAANGTFTGITQFNLGTPSNPILVGQPQSGFVMQLGNDLGGTVTLSGTNTYTGGTTITAGNLIIAGDAALGAAPPLTNAQFNSSVALNSQGFPTNALTVVQADNGIVFNSLTEGNGTLTIGTSTGGTYSTSRPIAVDSEAATINVNGNTVTLNGPLVSVGTNGVALGNADGESPLTIDDLSTADNGKLILSTPSPYFYGNIIIGNTGAPTVEVMSDAALGATNLPANELGQVELNGGILQAGASFGSVRSLFLGGGSTYDANGFTTTWAGTLTDVQRTLVIENSNSSGTGAVGNVTFGSLAAGSTAILSVNAGGSTTGGPGTTVTFTNGITRNGNSDTNAPANATVFINPATGSTLGVSGTNGVQVFSSGASATLTNGIVPVWMTTDSGGSASTNPYNFLTYSGTNGYQIATYASSFGASNVVKLSSSSTLATSSQAYALNLQNSKTLTIDAGQTLTIGNGTNPAGMILEGTTTTSGGTLAFGASEAVIDVKATNTISSAITGTGGLTLAGSGTLVLSGTAGGLSGPIVVDSGTLQLNTANYFPTSGGGTTVWLSNVKSKPSNAILAVDANNVISALNSDGSNSAVNIANGFTLTIGDSNNLNSTLSSVITGTGTGSLVKAGTGLLDISGSGGVSFGTGGSVSVNAGALRIGNGLFSSSATTPITVASGAELQYSGNGGSVFNDPISGAGVFHLVAGTVQLTGTNAYTGGTVLEVGTTLDVTTANLPTGGAVINAGGTLLFDQSTSGTFSGVMSNGQQSGGTGNPNDMSCTLVACTTSVLAGTLIKDDSATGSGGNVTLANVQAYTGMTYIEAGTLTLGAVNTIASSSGVDLGRVGGAVCNPSPCTGVTATLALGANNTISGLMDNPANTTQVQLNGHNLTLAPVAGTSWSYGGSIVDGSAAGGSLVQNGPGISILTGTSTYSGTTTVNSGVLEVNGAISNSSSVAVNSGGTLAGGGTVDPATVTISSGGTLAPGIPGMPGTSLTIAGNLAFQSGAIYLVQVGSSASTFAAVTGTASLGGNAIAAFAPGSYTQHYTILQAAGRSGTFASFSTIGLPTNFASNLSYTNTSVVLNLTAALGVGTALNVNQQNVANTLNGFFNGGGTLPPGFATLFGLTGGNLASALTQASGETATGSQQTTFDAMNLFMGLLTDPFVAGRGDGPGAGANAPGYAEEGYGVSAYAPGDRPRSQSERDAYAAIYRKAPPIADSFNQRWSVWAAGFGGSQATDGNTALGSNSTTSSIAGTAVGADYRFSPFTIAGFALAGGGTSFSVAGSGSGHSDLFQAGAFVRHTVGPAYISAALAYGWQDVTTNRTVSIAGTDMLQARFNANAFSGRLEGGYRFVAPVIGGVGVTPYAAAQFTTFDLPAYAESVLSGASTFALAYGAKDATDPRSELGIRTDKSYAMPGAILTLRSRVAWAYDYDPDRSIAATFQTLPGASFVVNGAAQAHDSALTTASAEIKWLNGFSVAATFEGEFSNVTQSYAGKGVVRYAW
jgi:fibronectin-binding autotransporter adhesin